MCPYLEKLQSNSTTDHFHRINRERIMMGVFQPRSECSDAYY